MNKTKIDWCDYSWNPITGCNGGCSYCYARKIYQRFQKSFKLVFCPNRLNEIDKIKKPSRIFLGSVTDLWDRMAKQEWRNQIFKRVILNREHNFICLTKQPQNISIDDCDKYLVNKKMPKNLWIGVSIESIDHMDRWVALSQKEYIRHKIISFEPMLDSHPITNIIKCFEKYSYPDWIIIGSLTKSDKESMLNSRISATITIELLKNAGIKTPIFVKDNVGRKIVQKEYPEELANL